MKNRKNKAQSLINTLVRENNVEAQQLAMRYGYRVRNNQELTKALHMILLEYQDRALTDFVNIHPDRELIQHLRRDEFNRSWGADGAQEQPKQPPVAEVKKPVIDQDTVHLILLFIGVWGTIKLFQGKV